MGLEHLSAVYDHSRQSGSHLMILLAVATHCDPGGEWVADQPTLQQRARLSRRYVQQLLRDLVCSGELAVTSHHGRGRRSTYRLLIAPPNAHPAAPFAEKAAVPSAYSAPERATPSAFSDAQSAPGSAFSHPPCPPCPPFPPDPQYPLNPPNPPEKQQQETFGLAPAPTPVRQAPSTPEKKAREAHSSANPLAPELPFPPLPAGGRAGAGRGAGGEGVFPARVGEPPRRGKGIQPRVSTLGEGGEASAVRPLTQPQSAVFRANLLLEEHAIPLPSPAQIGLWAKTLGGIEPLLDLLRRLIHAGLATKREPLAYIHRVVIERAARPESAAPATSAVPAWYGGHSRRPHNPILAAGVDDIRREQAARIAGITLPRSDA